MAQESPHGSGRRRHHHIRLVATVVPNVDDSQDRVSTSQWASYRYSKFWRTWVLSATRTRSSMPAIDRDALTK